MDDPIPLLRAPRRYFTPAEANALLPELIPMVHALAEGVERARQVGALMHEARDPRDRRAVARDLDEIQEANRVVLEGLDALGVQLKGLDPALLDFPAQREGQEVLLCWRQGEPEVAFWHPVHTGIRGRRPLGEEAEAVWEYWS